jgi:ribose transport system substrate-binding protein
LAKSVTATAGPNGEEPVGVDALGLSAADVAALQKKGGTIALVWAGTSPFIEAVQSGAESEAKRLGLSIVSTSQANFDAGKQANQLQTALAKKPDAIVSTPVDPATAKSMYDTAKAAGSKLVFLSNAPAGYKPGTDYLAIVTDDLQDMGARAADALATSMDGKGNVGIIYFDANFWVTNQRDAAFATRLREKYPDMTIAATQGFADPAKVGDVASAMLAKNPDLGGVYVSWSGPAEQVLSSLRAAGDSNVKLVTLDLDDTVVTDMAQHGNTVAVIADEAYDLGVGLADTAGLAILGRPAPPFVTVGSVTVLPDSIEQGYAASLHQKPSKTVQDAIG